MIHLPLVALTIALLWLSPRVAAAQAPPSDVGAESVHTGLQRLPITGRTDLPPRPLARSSYATHAPGRLDRAVPDRPAFAGAGRFDALNGRTAPSQPQAGCPATPWLAQAPQGPAFAGFDGPNEVSPAYGGNDMPPPPLAPPQVTAPAGDWTAVDPPGRTLSCWGRAGAGLCELKSKICADHCNFYSWPSLRDLAIGFGVGAAMANTSVDEGFQDWYQDDVRSNGTDDTAVFFKTFGEGQIFIPAFAGLALLNIFCDDLPVLGIAGEYGDRATRAYLVGAPPMLLMQMVTGASRPGEASSESYWQPFEDNNGVSGHAFMGAVPFITAARMTDSFLLKSGFYILSTFTAWSRINDDRHYLSQACLGWWMAYAACRSIDQTNLQRRHIALAPVATPELTGLALVIEH